MKVTPGTKFRLGKELRARWHREGWAGSERGGIEQVEAERVTVRCADGHEAVPDDETVIGDGCLRRFSPKCTHRFCGNF